MAIRTFTCPHCGATMNIDTDRRRVVCEYCDSETLLDIKSEGSRYQEPGRDPEPEVRSAAGGYSYGRDTEGSSTGAGYNKAPGYAASGVSPKSRMAALLLCVFLGIFGIHRFYVGKVGTGLLYFFTMSIFGFGYIFDIIMIVTGNFRDSRGLPLINW